MKKKYGQQYNIILNKLLFKITMMFLYWIIRFWHVNEMYRRRKK